MGIVYQNISYSVTVSRYQYKLNINGSAWNVDAYQYDVSISNSTIILQSRSDGVVNGTSFFRAFISQAPGNTLVLKEGVDVMRMEVGIDQALGSSLESSEYRIGGRNNTNYWLDIDGGSDMGGLTYQVVTGSVKINGTIETNAVSKFMVNFLGDSGDGQKIAFEPSVMLSSSVGNSDSGKNDNSTFDLTMMIVLIAAALLGVMAFILVRRIKKGSS